MLKVIYRPFPLAPGCIVSYISHNHRSSSLLFCFSLIPGAYLLSSGTMKGETAYCKGQTDYRTGLVLFLCAMNVFKRDGRNEAAVYKRKLKTERNRESLFDSFPGRKLGRDKWRGGRMEGVESTNEQMERANRIYRDKFKAGEK